MKLVRLLDEDFVNILGPIDADKFKWPKFAQNNIRMAACCSFQQSDSIPEETSIRKHKLRIGIARDGAIGGSCHTFVMWEENAIHSEESPDGALFAICSSKFAIVVSNYK